MKRSIMAIHASLLTLAAATAVAAPLYDLPLKGDDLGDAERYFIGKDRHSPSGEQMWGYDIGLMTHDGNGAWSEVKPGTDWKNISNSDYSVYGKPVYAMGSGKVVACWRNAPENPRPFSAAMGDKIDEPFLEQDWLHVKWRELMMPVGGNHLLVEEAGGNRILYAHAQPGSIPSSLCPHNGTFFSKASAFSEADVSAEQKIGIEAGQLLYKIGNTGNSSAPHLHVHKYSPARDPIQMEFRRGLSTPVTAGNKADINKWTTFAGKTIPAGPVLLWPPRRLGAEYARHGLDVGVFQGWFDHLVDSGFWLEWIDGYSVSGKPFVNFVWRPALGTWGAFHLLTGADYQAEFDEATQAGFAPVHVDSSVVNGTPRYSVIFVKNKPGGVLAGHGMTEAQHNQLRTDAIAGGLSPTSVSVVSVGGVREYTALYRSDSIGVWDLDAKIPAAQYQAVYNANKAAGRFPSYANAYVHGGQTFFSVVFSQLPAGLRNDKHGLTGAQYQTEYNSALTAGLLTRVVSGYDGASNHLYIATWRE